MARALRSHHRNLAGRLLRPPSRDRVLNPKWGDKRTELNLGTCIPKVLSIDNYGMICYKIGREAYITADIYNQT